MIRAFAARIAFLNALLSIAIFAILGAVAAVVVYVSVQSRLSSEVAETAREVPVVAAYYGRTTLAEAAPHIIAQLERPGVRAVVVDPVTHRIYDARHPRGLSERDGPRGAPFDLAPPGGNDGAPGAPPGSEGMPPGDEHGSAGSPPDRGSAPDDGGPPPDGGPPGATLGSGATIDRGGTPPRGDLGHAFTWLIRVDRARVAIRGGFVDLAPEPGTLGTLWPLFVIATLVAALLAALASWAIGRSLTRASMRPLDAVTRELSRFGEGDFSPRAVETLDGGEYAGLAGAYNRAAAQVARALDERAAAEREMRQFIADAAHELRTPLTIVTGYVELLRAGVAPERAEKIFATIGIESDRMRACISKLIALARLDASHEPRREAVDLVALARGVVETFDAVDDTRRIALTTAEGAIVTGDPAEFQEALMNLLDNAMRYGDGAPIEVRVDRTTPAEVRLVVADRGPGMTEDEAAHAFARFYRGEARGEREGSGLGLAIVARIVQRAGGSVELVTAPGRGATFTLRFPAGDTAAPRRS